MKEYRVTMYAPDQKFHFIVTASSREDAERTALKRVMVINIEKLENE